MTTSAELELVLIHAHRASELARFFHQPQEIVERIEAMKREAIQIKAQMSEKKREFAWVSR